MTFEPVNKIYQVEATCLTPVHISSGDEIKSWEYIVTDDKTFYRLDLFAFFKKIIDKNPDKVWALLEEGNLIKIRNFIYSQREKLSGILEKTYLYKNKVSDKFYELYEKNISDQQKHEESNQLIIKEFIRSNNEPFIPGSSIKGALRTALENSGYKEENFYRKFQVKDSNFFTENAVNVEVIDRANSVDDQVELIPSGEKFNFKIKIDKRLDNFTASKLRKKVNNFMKEKISKYEKNLIQFKKLAKKEDDSDKVEQLADLQNKLSTLKNETEGKQMLLNLGFGGGYWYKSLKERHPDWGNVESYKNSKLQIPRTWWRDESRLPLGFVKCKLRKK